MRADYELTRSAIRHEGIRGGDWEETLRRFLRSYLPGGLEVSTGVLIDSSGTVTRQLDVIIYDAVRTPVLYRGHNARVVPIEFAFAVIEVKSRLTGTELKKVFRNMASVYALRPVPPLKLVNMQQIPSEDSHIFPTFIRIEQSAPFDLKGVRHPHFPINYYVFAHDSMRINTLLTRIDQYHREKNLPLHQRLDMVCVLEKGLICNQHVNGSDSAVPEKGSRLHAASIPRRLLAFYMLMAQVLLQARSQNIDLTHYVKAVNFRESRGAV